MRWYPSPLEAMFVLGNRATVPLLASELDRWQHHSNLATLDHLLGDYDDGTFWEESFYNSWLRALSELHVDTTGREYPDVMRTETWERRMLNAQLASLAHLKHDSILYAKPSFPPCGCYYPDGWIDPYPQFYERVAGLARRGIDTIDPLVSSPGLGLAAGVIEYFERLEEASTRLADIARTELAGDEFSESQAMFIARWLSQRAMGCGIGLEHEVDRDGEPMVLDGWYPQIIYLRNDGDFDDSVFSEGEDFDPTVADVHTVRRPGGTWGTLHMGVGYAHLTVLTTHNDCGTRAYAGPTMSYYEFIEEGAELRRWTDEEWSEALVDREAAPRPEWTREFVR